MNPLTLEETPDFKKAVFKSKTLMFVNMTGGLIAAGLIIGFLIGKFSFYQGIYLSLGLIFVYFYFIPSKVVIILNKKLDELEARSVGPFWLTHKRKFPKSSSFILANKKFLNSPRNYRPLLVWKSNRLILVPCTLFCIDFIYWNNQWNWNKEDLDRISEFLGLTIKY
jgi:hypothetical protein